MKALRKKILKTVVEEGEKGITYSVPIRKLDEDSNVGLIYGKLFLLKMKAREFADGNYGSVGYEGLTELGKAEHEGLMCGWIEACEAMMELLLEKE